MERELSPLSFVSLPRNQTSLKIDIDGYRIPHGTGRQKTEVFRPPPLVLFNVVM